ncbi:MAG: cyclic nucleotide-binding domain-containing protein [Gammaproteobacteria bacterium]
MAELNSYATLKDLLIHPEFVEGDIWYRKRYKAHELVIVEGETNKEIFVVLDGKLSVCTDVKISENRKMISGLCELLDGEEFAHSCFFDDEPHSATVKAITDCELAVIDAAKLKFFLDRHPQIGYQVLSHWIRLLLPRLRQGNKRFASLFSWGLKAHRLDSKVGLNAL